MTAPFVRCADAALVADAIRDRIGGGPMYMSIDIDVLDPSVAPGTGTPVPAGLHVHELKQIFYTLAEVAELDLVGTDLVEVSPPYDLAEISAINGCSLLLDAICLAATWHTEQASPDPLRGGAPSRSEGLPVQAMNWPKRPRLRTITRPQFSQYSSAAPVSCTSAESRSGKLIGFSLVKVQLSGLSFS